MLRGYLPPMTAWRSGTPPRMAACSPLLTSPSPVLSGAESALGSLGRIQEQTCFPHSQLSGVRPGAEVEKVVDSASLTRRKYFQKLGLTENIWENIMI